MAERRPSDSAPRDVDVEKGISPNASDVEGATIRPDSGREAALNPDDAPKENDPNIVDWDGPDDPQNPQNWPASQKWMNIAVISILTLVT